MIEYFSGLHLSFVNLALNFIGLILLIIIAVHLHLGARIQKGILKIALQIEKWRLRHEEWDEQHHLETMQRIHILEQKVKKIEEKM